MDLKVVALLVLGMLLLNILFAWGITLAICSIFGITEPWVKGIIMAIIFASNQFKAEVNG